MRCFFIIFAISSVLTASAVGTDGKRLRPPGGCCSSDVMTRTYVPTTRSSSGLQGDVRIPIILAAFSDVPFTIPDVQQVWEDIANKPGYSEHGASGCMADYFQEQSRGQFRVTFDVLGPVTLTHERAYYGQNSSSGRLDVKVSEMIRDACSLVADLPGVELSNYVWSTPQVVETVLVVYAGCGENVKGAPADAVWPKMGYAFSSVGDYRLSSYACANELLWPGLTQEGFGTLLHEFSHCLGLPDLYNTDNSVDDYIIFDEWDLMDGGCYAGDSWRPVGYSAYERYLCGWLDPEELTEPTAVENLKPLTAGGQAYLIRNDGKDNECFLLENRQQESFDTLLPGHGLLITHVSGYGSTSMSPNYGASVKIYPVPADNLDYRWSVKQYVHDYYGVTLPDDALNLTAEYMSFRYDEQGRSRLMAGTAYPYVKDGVVLNNELTDDSTPKAVTLDANASGEKLLSRPVKGIREEAGLISFSFMDPSAALPSSLSGSRVIAAYFDLYGRRIPAPAVGSVSIVRYADGTTQKIVR